MRDLVERTMVINRGLVKSENNNNNKTKLKLDLDSCFNPARFPISVGRLGNGFQDILLFIFVFFFIAHFLVVMKNKNKKKGNSEYSVLKPERFPISVGRVAIELFEMSLWKEVGSSINEFGMNCEFFIFILCYLLTS